MDIPKYRFAPASPEGKIVYGAERPGYGSRNVSVDDIRAWILYMRDKGISRVCCLLDEEQIQFYNEVPLLDVYRKEFGENQVIHALVPDYHLCSVEMLQSQILPFLEDSRSQNAKTVVHCAGGKGRTGHILAAWVVRSESKSPEEALDIVSKLYREPYEAVEKGNATQQNLQGLLVRAAG